MFYIKRLNLLCVGVSNDETTQNVKVFFFIVVGLELEA
jgi:hypothetical protein